MQAEEARLLTQLEKAMLKEWAEGNFCPLNDDSGL